MFSAPVTSQGIPAFVAESDNKIIVNGTTYAVAYYYNNNPSAKRWKYHIAGPTLLVNQQTLVTFTSGLGYTMNRKEVGHYTFTGTMANGDVTMTIPFVNSGSHYWSSIGNPIPFFFTSK